jgi:peptidase M15-like protein
MGDISKHFSRRDFNCKCGQCNKEFKISLTLVGVLEAIREHFNKRIEILTGHICEEENTRQGRVKKDYHMLGKAAKITVLNAPLNKVFQYMETISQIHGLGYDPQKKLIYFDLRDKNEKKWVWEGENDLELTPQLREKYELGTDQTEQPEPQEQVATSKDNL